MTSEENGTILFRRAPVQLDRRVLKQFRALLLQRVARGRDFSCLVTDDRELRRLNARFLHHDSPTDVLSFPAGQSGPASEENAFLGEIAISAERASEQAREFGHSLEEEIRILMLHGLLHLLGHDHETDRGRMGRIERAWRAKLGLPAGLIERAST